MKNVVIVSRKSARQLKEGHPWGFRGEIRALKGDPAAGDLVEVLDEGNHPVGWALYSPKPLIALRMVSLGAEPLAEGWVEARLHAAEALRRIVIAGDTDAYRAVYSESDGLPGLIVDRYADVLSVQVLSVGMEVRWPQIQACLVEMYHPRAIVLRNDQKVRELEGLEVGKSVPLGDAPEPLVVHENGLKFRVDVMEGQKTGAYLDQRENRLAARQYAKGRVLEAFTYQGWFAMNLAAHCDEVIALDGSAPALEQLEENARLNGITNVTAVKANVFDYLTQALEAGERFDTILLDPPAFCKNKRSVKAGMRGYKDINYRAMRLLDPGQFLITSSCSYHLTEDLFMEVLQRAARDAGRMLQIVDRRTQGRDHPKLLGHPESYYLKTFVLRVL